MKCLFVFKALQLSFLIVPGFSKCIVQIPEERWLEEKKMSLRSIREPGIFQIPKNKRLYSKGSLLTAGEGAQLVLYPSTVFLVSNL